VEEGGGGSGLRGGTVEKEGRGRHSQLSGDGRPVGRPVAGAVEGRVPKFRIRSCTFLIDAAEPLRYENVVVVNCLICCRPCYTSSADCCSPGPSPVPRSSSSPSSFCP